MDFILDFLFPKHCVGCNKEGTYFCPSCILEIEQGSLVCPNCERVSLGGATHPICKKRNSLDGLWSLGLYHEPLSSAIHKLKYKFITDIAQILIAIVTLYWKKEQPLLLELIRKDRGNWLIIPVPLHFYRQNWRGFNQSSLLGKLFSKKLGIKFIEPLKRTKHTKPQVKLESNQREKNIKGIFAFKKGFKLEGKNILLIDDVWTTGSTLKECCKVLKENGAAQVWGFTIAR